MHSVQWKIYKTDRKEWYVSMLKVLVKENEVEEINTYYNQPDNTDDIVNLCDIKIPQDFAQTKPLAYKMNRYTRSFHKLGHLDKPITVIAETNEYGKKNKLLLVDGYTRFLIACKYGLTKVPVKYIDINDYCNERNI